MSLKEMDVRHGVQIDQAETKPAAPAGWRGFRGGKWMQRIDVKDFLDRNLYKLN